MVVRKQPAPVLGSEPTVSLVTSQESSEPTLRDEDRMVHDIPKLRREVKDLQARVRVAKAVNKYLDSNTVSVMYPYLYNTSELLVEKILKEDPSVDANVDILFNLLATAQSQNMSGEDTDQSFGVLMAEKYFPEDVLKKEDFASSEKMQKMLSTKPQNQ